MAAIDLSRPIFKRRLPEPPVGGNLTQDDLDALQRDLEAMAQAPSVPQVAPVSPPPAFKPGRYPGTTGVPLPYSMTVAPPISEVEQKARDVYARSPALHPEPFDLGALARGIPRAVGQALSPTLPGYEKSIRMAPSPDLNLPFGYQSQEEVNRAQELVRETTEGPLGVLGALPPYIGPAIAVQAARTPLQAALRIGLEMAGQPIREAPIAAARAGVRGTEAVVRASARGIQEALGPSSLVPGARAVQAGRKGAISVPRQGTLISRVDFQLEGVPYSYTFRKVGEDYYFDYFKNNRRINTQGPFPEDKLRDLMNRASVPEGATNITGEMPFKSPAPEAPLPGQAGAGAAAKQPWEMTAARYIEQKKQELESFAGTTFTKPMQEGVRADHSKRVQQALSEGKPVPDAVLADYPDLAQAAQNQRADAFMQGLKPPRERAPRPLSRTAADKEFAARAAESPAGAGEVPGSAVQSALPKGIERGQSLYPGQLDALARHNPDEIVLLKARSFQGRHFVTASQAREMGAAKGEQVSEIWIPRELVSQADIGDFAEGLARAGGGSLLSPLERDALLKRLEPFLVFDPVTGNRVKSYGGVDRVWATFVNPEGRGLESGKQYLVQGEKRGEFRIHATAHTAEDILPGSGDLAAVETEAVRAAEPPVAPAGGVPSTGGGAMITQQAALAKGGAIPNIAEEMTRAAKLDAAMQQVLDIRFTDQELQQTLQRVRPGWDWPMIDGKLASALADDPRWRVDLPKNDTTKLIREYLGFPEVQPPRGLLPEPGGGARKLTQQELQDALLGKGAGAAPPQTIGARAPGGGIVGAQPTPPTPIPGQAPTPQPPREFWARPLANLEMIAGAFKDNFWRSAAQRTGLRQFTSIIDPAALVSGTATDPVSITNRALLLRNRVLDVGDSGVNGGMAWLREKPNPFNIGGDARISSLPGKPMWYDVFDNPGHFRLTPEQAEYVKLYQDMLDDALTLAKQNGIPIRELTLGADRHYIPRLVEALRGIENEKAGRVGGRIGAKAGFQKTRFYEWTEEGVAKGVVYSNDLLTVMEHHVQSTYRLIADKRLADEMAPLGETILERVEQKAPGLFAAREISKKEFTRARELLSAVNRAYRGERLPPSLVASIGRSFPNEAAALKVAGPNSPALQPIEQAAKSLMAQHRSNWQNISVKMNRVKDAVQPGFDEGWIPQPFAQGRIFSKEVVQAVTQATGDIGNSWLRAVQVPSVISRTIGTTIDFGAPFIQGLGVLGENPGAWARATLKHYQAFLDPAAKQRYFTQNAENIKEMAQYGANVGTTEFFAGNRPITGAFKLLPEEVKNVTTWMGKQSVGRFQEAFGTFLDVSAVEMWKGLRGRALQEGPDSLFALADYVSHARGTMSQRTIGIGVSQQQIESGLMMFAPRYTKAGFALFSDIATLPPYLKGNAIRANLSAIIGSAATFYLAGATALNALGLMKSEEVQERLNPIKNGRFNSKFLTLPIGTDNVGMGSFGYSMLRLLAGTTDKAINEPGDLLKLDAQDNPIMGFFRSRLVGGAPAASLAIELFTGRNYFGEKFDQPADYAAAVAQRLLPFWAEAYIGHIPAFQERDLFQQPPASLEALPSAFAGQRVFPQSYGSRAGQLEEQLAQERGWTLPINRDQRRQLEAANPELAKLKGQAETQSEKFAKDEAQQQTADYFTDVDKSKVLRERSLEAPYRGFLNGKLSGKELLDIRSDASTEMAGAIALGREKYPLSLVDRAAREAYYAANRIEIKEGNPDDIAAEGYYSIRVPTGEEGKDFDAFFKAREDYLKQFTPEVQEYITKVYLNKRFEQEWMNKLEAEIQADMETLRPYWEIRDLAEQEIPVSPNPLVEVQRAKARDRIVDRKHEAMRNTNTEVRKAWERWGYGKPRVPIVPAEGGIGGGIPIGGNIPIGSPVGGTPVMGTPISQPVPTPTGLSGLEGLKLRKPLPTPVGAGR